MNELIIDLFAGGGGASEGIRLALAVRIAEALEWHDECQATLRWAGNWWDRAARHKGMEELEDICRDARREIGQAKWDAWGDVNEDKYKAWGEGE